MFFTVRRIDGFVINVDDFDGDDLLLSQVLGELRSRYKLAFTSRKSADLTRFGIAEEDVFRPRSLFEVSMFQNVIRRAIQRMGTLPSSTVFLCRRAGLLRNAHELLLGTIVIVPPAASDEEKLSVYQQFPDFLISNISDLRNCLSGENVGFGGEFSAAPPGVFIFDPDSVRICQFPSVPNSEHPDCPVYVAGRYFGFSDPRHSLHALSIRIVRSKKNPAAQAKCFADLFIRGAWWASGGQIDMITRVPPRPGEQVDRLLLYLNEMSTTAIFRTESLISTILRPDVLECTVKYPKQTAQNFQGRKESVRGAFQAQPDVTGKKVVLLDDVQTTGATLNECIHMLKKAGAKSVLPLVLGYHPYTLQTLGLTDDHELHCTSCNSTLIGRCKRENGEPFFGCSGWQQDDGRSHSYKGFANGINEKLSLMQNRLMQPDEELQSEDIRF